MYCSVLFFFCLHKNALNIDCSFTSFFSSLNFPSQSSAACILLFASSLIFCLFSHLSDTSSLSLTALAALWQFCKKRISYNYLSGRGEEWLELEEW